MMLTVGSKVVYPCQGPCLIGAVVEKIILDNPESFYRLVLLDDRGGELFVPVEKAGSTGIRLLMRKAELPELFDHLTTKTNIASDWHQRAKDILKRFTSGSAFDLAEIIESLTTLSERKMLSLREDWILRRARTMLACEIAEVLGETKRAAEQRVDQALKARKTTTVSAAANASLSNLGQSVQ